MPERRCPKTGKVCLTLQVARARARNRRRLHGERVGEYHCDTCASWHIGHSTPLPKRSRLR